MFGGAGLNEEVGDSLASKGVSLWSEYGWYGHDVTAYTPDMADQGDFSSEAGQINAFGRREYLCCHLESGE